MITKSNIGYSRLKYVFRHGIGYAHYPRLVQNVKSPIIGNIPKDILDKVITEHPNSKKNAIQQTQQNFINLARILSRNKTIIDEDHTEISKRVFINFIERNRFKIKTFIKLKKLSKDLKKHLSKIIPEINKTKLSYVGNGSFGDVYKIEIFDKNKSKLFEDKTIKIFKEKDTNNKDYDDAYIYRMHGAFAEANISEYIRHMSGHKLKISEGIVIPEMFYLGEKPFCISKFINKTDSASKTFNFKKLGLKNSDQNYRNYINEICIDIGGLRPYKTFAEFVFYEKKNKIDEIFKSDIIGNKISTKIIKKMFDTPIDQRNKYLKELEKKAKKCQNEIEKRSILSTIDEIRKKY